MNKKSLLYKFFSFLRSPKYNQVENINLGQKIIINIRLFAPMYLLVVFSGVMLSILFSIINFQNGDSFAIEFFLNESIITIILAAVIIAPLSEELAFRLGLKYSIPRFIISSLLIFSFAKSLFSINISETLIPFLVIFIVAFEYFALRIIGNSKMQDFYKNYFYIIFYLSALAFGFIHSFNYKNIADIWFLAPLLVMPQLIVGIFFGYFRVKLGFIFSIANHAFYNFMTLSPLLVLSILGIDLVDPNALDQLSNTQNLGLVALLLMSLAVLFTIILINLYNLIELFNKDKLASA